jgi:hypothetical protein
MVKVWLILSTGILLGFLYPHSPQFSGWEVPVHTDSRLM